MHLFKIAQLHGSGRSSLDSVVIVLGLLVFNLIGFGSGEKEKYRNQAFLFRHAALLVLEKNAKAAARSCLQYSQSSLARVLGTRNLGGCQVPIEMGLDGRMSRAKCALLFRLSSAHRTTNRQYMSQRQFPRFDTNLIQREFPNAPRPPSFVGKKDGKWDEAAC